MRDIKAISYAGQEQREPTH